MTLEETVKVIETDIRDAKEHLSYLEQQLKETNELIIKEQRKEILNKYIQAGEFFGQVISITKPYKCKIRYPKLSANKKIVMTIVNFDLKEQYTEITETEYITLLGHMVMKGVI